MFAEAFRVLKPGGKAGRGGHRREPALPDSVLSNIDFWTGCVSGALLERTTNRGSGRPVHGSRHPPLARILRKDAARSSLLTPRSNPPSFRVSLRPSTADSFVHGAGP